MAVGLELDDMLGHFQPIPFYEPMFMNKGRVSNAYVQKNGLFVSFLSCQVNFNLLLTIFLSE